jgi:hypothetical protein
MTKAETPNLINRKRNNETPNFTSTNQEIFIIDTYSYLNIEALSNITWSEVNGWWLR